MTVGVIPAAAHEITPRWLTATLRGNGVIASDVSVTDARGAPLGNGQLGQVIRIELQYNQIDGGPDSMVAKLPAREDGRRQFAEAIGAYDAEVRFYRDIAPGIDMAVPGVFGSAFDPATGRFILLLEDLSATTVPGDTVAGASLEQTSTALRALPGLQKATWHLPRLVNDPWWGDHGRSHMVFALAPPALPLLEERFGSELASDYLDIVRWVAAVADRLPAVVWTAPFVIAHGDYRLDNMLFSAGLGGPALSMIDWQAARLGPPPLDVAMFLGPNLDPQLRRSHERELLREYHQGLVSAGVDGYSFDDCWRSYRLCVLYPLSGAIAGATLLAQTDRDAQVWLRILRNCAQMCLDLETVELFD